MSTIVQPKQEKALFSCGLYPQVPLERLDYLVKKNQADMCLLLPVGLKTVQLRHSSYYISN